MPEAPNMPGALGPGLLGLCVKTVPPLEFDLISIFINFILKLIIPSFKLIILFFFFFFNFKGYCQNNKRDIYKNYLELIIINVKNKEFTPL